MLDELDEHDANANQCHHVCGNNEIGRRIQPVGNPQDRTNESLDLRRNGDSLNGVVPHHSKCLWRGEDQGQRDAHHAEQVAEIHLATLGAWVYRSSAMYTTYAATLSTRKWTEETRMQVAEYVSQWKDATYPQDRLPGDVRLRTRNTPDDEVYRLVVDTTTPQSTTTRTLVITLTPHNGRLVFDVRIHVSPHRDSIVPRRRAELAPEPVLDLIAEVAQRLEVYDAERRVGRQARVIGSHIEGQALAADVMNAPTRRLPIVVETIIGKSKDTTLTGPLVRDLVGIAHVVHVTDDAAINAFNEFYGSNILSRNYVTILWPQPEEPFTLTTTQPTRDQIIAPILHAAALQPAIPVQPPPRQAIPARQPAASSKPPTNDTSHDTQIAMLKHEVEERRAHIEQLDEELERTEIERDEISEMLEEEQIKVEELSTEISLLRGRLSAVILQAVDLEAELERAKPERVLRRVLDAVNRARTECANLEFARSAFETADRLHGPNPRDILHDLKALDAAVAAWRSDTFPSAGLTSYLRDTSGLDYVARVGEDTIHRHGAWYTVNHNGESLHIGPHLRAGKNRTLNRIYLHVDTQRRRIVVGKIVAHGPDSTT